VAVSTDDKGSPGVESAVKQIKVSTDEREEANLHLDRKRSGKNFLVVY
jgi:hypothetical protein